MDKQAKAKRIGYQIGLLFVIGVIAYGAQLHRFFPFIGPAIGLPVLPPCQYDLRHLPPRDQ
jgi:hypothetical protein